jgi:hypothetical protein
MLMAHRSPCSSISLPLVLGRGRGAGEATVDGLTEPNVSVISSSLRTTALAPHELNAVGVVSEAFSDTGSKSSSFSPMKGEGGPEKARDEELKREVCPGKHVSSRGRGSAVDCCCTKFPRSHPVIEFSRACPPARRPFHNIEAEVGKSEKVLARTNWCQKGGERVGLGLGVDDSRPASLTNAIPNDGDE